MAFIIENAKSERLNRINVGQRVTLCDFKTKSPFATATLKGWSIGDKPTQAPSSMKEMPANIQQHFVNVVNNEGAEIADVTLVLEPGAYGAMFVTKTTGEGENTKTTYRRVTAYAALADIEAKAAAKAKVKAEKAAAKVAEVTEEAPSTEPEAKEAKASKGRKGKNKEVSQDEIAEVTEV